MSKTKMAEGDVRVYLHKASGDGKTEERLQFTVRSHEPAPGSPFAYNPLHVEMTKMGLGSANAVLSIPRSATQLLSLAGTFDYRKRHGLTVRKWQERHGEYIISVPSRLLPGDLVRAVRLRHNLGGAVLKYRGWLYSSGVLQLRRPKGN